MVKRLVFLLFLLILILGGCTEKDIMAEQFGIRSQEVLQAEDFLPFIDSATYYGCFTVFDSDVAWITEWPITSHGTAVVLESGTYADLMTLVHTQTKGEIP